jgi:DNA-binding protein HU-beta
MTKAELVESVASRVDLPRAKAEEVVTTLFDDIARALKEGEKVNVSGFGIFSVSTRKARTGRNPKTGETIEIAASRAAKFRPGKTLKGSLN